MHLLIIGGPTFLGRFLAEAALQKGHNVTFLNRSGRALPHPHCRVIAADRRAPPSLAALGAPDIIVDTCAYHPADLMPILEMLRGHFSHYLLLSTLSVFALDGSQQITESSAREQISDSDLDRLRSVRSSSPVYSSGYGQFYGALKARCEDILADAHHEKALIVRPGLLIGPHDYTDRFTYWVLRAARGGKIIAGGQPNQTRQLLDVRDLAQWLLRMGVSHTTGTVNVTGPGPPPTMETILQTCADQCPASRTEYIWTSDDVLLSHGVSPWSELPLWIPLVQEPAMVNRVDTSVAERLGLTVRPLAESASDVLAWAAKHKTLENLRAGLPSSKEAQILRFLGHVGFHQATEEV